MSILKSHSEKDKISKCEDCYSIAVLLTLCSRNCTIDSIDNIPFLKILYPSLVRNLPKNIRLTFFVGYDDDDVFYDMHAGILRERGFNVYKLYHCQHAPAKAWNKIFNIAYYDSKTFDYFLQIGDDVEMEHDWVTTFIDKLKENEDLGIVGPCEPVNYYQRMNSGGSWIIENAFVSRTHFHIFKTFFHPTIKNWFCDNWITDVYRPRYAHIFTDIKCKNTVRDQRYTVAFPDNLENYIQEGKEKVQKFIDGKRVKVFSFCIYGHELKYCQGLLENIHLIQEHYPDFEVWIYGGFDVPIEYVEKYQSYPCVRYIELPLNDIRLMYHRFMPIDDPYVDICFIRDADSRIYGRDQWCIQKFLESSKTLHIIRDHPWHAQRIMGGMWGIKKEFMTNCPEEIREMYHKWLKGHQKEWLEYRGDQYFLSNCIYTRIKDNELIHSNYNFFRDEKLNSIEYPDTPNEFVGNAYTYEDGKLKAIFFK